MSHLGQQRQDLVAYPVTPKTQLGVGGVDDGDQAQGVNEGSRFRPPQVEDGPAHGPAAGATGPHATKAVQPGPPQKVQQQRLGLVVGRVAHQHALGERSVASRPGPRFQVRPRGHRHRYGLGTSAQRERRRPHHLGLSATCGAQPMVDVHGVGPAAGGHGQGQHGQGVCASGHRTDHELARRGERTSTEQGSGLRGPGQVGHELVTLRPRPPPLRRRQKSGGALQALGPGYPRRRLADLSQGRQPLRALPDPLEELRPAGPFHRLDETLALLVLLELGV